jgi:hypothetical protein
LKRIDDCYLRHSTQSFLKADVIAILEGKAYIPLAFLFEDDVVKAEAFFRSQLLFFLLLDSTLLL